MEVVSVATSLPQEFKKMVGGFNREQINEAWELLRARSKQIKMIAAGSFYVGEKVAFKTKKGIRFEGTVEKVNPVSISIKTYSPYETSYKVSPGLVEKVE